jgi:hypothetical protein
MKSRSHHTKAHTFASRTSHSTKQSLQKSMLLSNRRRNSIFFSPSLRCFNFFATAQTTTDRQSDNLLLPLTGQYNLTRTTEARTANSTFALGGVSCSADSFVVAESSVLRINISGKNPAHRKSAKR